MINQDKATCEGLTKEATMRIILMIFREYNETSHTRNAGT